MNVNYSLDPITDLCLTIYPDQIDVIQATTQVQYWQGGPDPLDFINIYINNESSLPHYHYVSLGLSDLYGDNRIYQKVDNLNEDSGFGYELTIRVKKDDNLNQPPVWPLRLMQALARYTFKNGILLSEGDHIPNILSDNLKKINHVLIGEDSILKSVQTKFGRVKFLQLIGCTDDELMFAQKWSTAKILNKMKEFNELDKEYLVTDLDRNKSIFELRKNLKEEIFKLTEQQGSDLSFVNSNCYWKLKTTVKETNEINQNNENSISWSEIEIFFDLKSARLFYIILKQRLQKQKSFIFNDLKSRNLILIPPNFKNKNLIVNGENILKSNKNETETQLYLDNKSIKLIHDYFKYVKLDRVYYSISDNQYKLPMSKIFLLGDENTTKNKTTVKINILNQNEFNQLF